MMKKGLGLERKFWDKYCDDWNQLIEEEFE